MEKEAVRIVICGISYGFDDYCALRDLLDQYADNVAETNDDDGTYFPKKN